MCRKRADLEQQKEMYEIEQVHNRENERTEEKVKYECTNMKEKHDTKEEEASPRGER